LDAFRDGVVAVNKNEPVAFAAALHRGAVIGPKRSFGVDINQLVAIYTPRVKG